MNIQKIILIFFVFIFVPVIAFLLISSRTSILFGLRTFNVLTGSMEPKIHIGSLVFTSPSTRYNVGDIITFHRGDISVTHRIAAIKNGQFVTKGDRNKTVDPQRVSKGDIIGKDIIIIPYFGKVITFIKTVPGFILFIGIPALIFIGFEAKTIKQEWEKEIEKKLLKNIKGVEQT